MAIISNIGKYLMDAIVILLSTAGAMFWLKELKQKHEIAEFEKERTDEEIKSIDTSVDSKSLADLASDDNREYLARKTDQKK